MSQTLQPTGWIMQYYATVLGRHLTWLNIECQYSGHVNSLCQKVCLSSITISDNFMNLQDTHTVISRFNDDKKNKINKNTANKNTRALDYSICRKPDSVDTNNFLFFLRRRSQQSWRRHGGQKNTPMHNYQKIKNILALTSCRSTCKVHPRDNLVKFRWW